MTATPEPCHCGKAIDMSEGRNRGMCTDCDDVRCDAYPGACDGVEVVEDPDRRDERRQVMIRDEPIDESWGLTLHPKGDETPGVIQAAPPEPTVRRKGDHTVVIHGDWAHVFSHADGKAYMLNVYTAVIEAARRRGGKVPEGNGGA